MHHFLISLTSLTFLFTSPQYVCAQEPYPLQTIPPTVTEYNSLAKDATRRISDLLRNPDQEAATKIRELSERVSDRLEDLTDNFNARGASAEEKKWLQNEAKTWSNISTVAPELAAASTKMGLQIFLLDKEIRDHRSISAFIETRFKNAQSNYDRVEKEIQALVNKLDDANDLIEKFTESKIKDGVLNIIDIQEKYVQSLDPLDDTLPWIASEMTKESDEDWTDALTVIQATIILSQKCNEDVVNAKNAAREQQRQILILRDQLLKRSIDTDPNKQGFYDTLWLEWLDLLDRNYDRFTDVAGKVDAEFTTLSEKFKKISVFFADKSISWASGGYLKLEDIKVGADPLEKLQRGVSAIQTFCSNARNAIQSFIDRRTFSKRGQVRLLNADYLKKVQTLMAKWDAEIKHENNRIQKIRATNGLIEKQILKKLEALKKEMDKYRSRGDAELLEATEAEASRIRAELKEIEDDTIKEEKESDLVASQIKSSFARQLSEIAHEWEQAEKELREWLKTSEKNEKASKEINQNRQILVDQPKQVTDAIEAAEKTIETTAASVRKK